MKTKLFRWNLRRTPAGNVTWILGVACLALVPAYTQDASPGAAKKEEPKVDDAELRNWIEVSLGANLVRGDRAAFQQRTGQPKNVSGGVTDFHYEQDIGKKGLFEVDGRGIFDAHNYAVVMSLKNPDFGYVTTGYEEFSTYYDGSGGYFTGNGAFLDLVGNEMEVDRKRAFFEAGLTLENKPQVRVRYEWNARDGVKNSTSWGDTALTGGAGTRKIVPSFSRLNEDRHIVSLDVSHTISNTEAGVGGRYEFTTYDNGRYERRNPGEATDRVTTQREGVDSDLFNIHAFTVTDLSDLVKFSTGYSFTKLDTDISGSRIIGADYDAMFDPAFVRRQARDHGFFALSGGSTLNQHVGTFSMMFRPIDDWAIVPSIRIESQVQDGVSIFKDTEVGAAPAKVTGIEDVMNSRHRDFIDVTESLEVRYTGFTNWVLYSRAEVLEGDGTLSERERFIDEGTFPLSRTSDSSRITEKYVAGANWYPHKKVNAAVQYYHKIRENDYDHVADSTPFTTPAPSEGYYPAFIRDQNFTQDDLNIRLTVRPVGNLSFVSRYDFQFSTIDSQMGTLPEVQSARGTTHIFTESVAWSPLARLFLQASGSYTLDELSSPADDIIPGRVQVSKNNYYTASGTVGYALTDRTDVTANYNYYLADNYDPSNFATGMAYGAGSTEHEIGLGLLHRFSKRMQLLTRYAFLTSKDETSGGHNNFDAHLIAMTWRFRF
jgi:hypothetical protein